MKWTKRDTRPGRDNVCAWTEQVVMTAYCIACNVKAWITVMGHAYSVLGLSF